MIRLLIVLKIAFSFITKITDICVFFSSVISQLKNMNWRTFQASFLPALRNIQSIVIAEFQKQLRNNMNSELR